MGDYEISNITRGTIIGIAVVALALAIYMTIFRGVTKGPTFIDFIRSGDAAVELITNIEILKTQPGVWEFSEKEYSRLDRKIYSSKEQLNEFVSLLRADTIDSRTHRNHPGHCYKMYIKVNLSNDDFYYVLFGVYKYKGYKYCSIDSLFRNVSNPNGGKHYENRKFVSFLQAYDPWYPEC